MTEKTLKFALTGTKKAKDDQIARYIKTICADFYQVSEQDAQHRKRKREFVKVRQMAMYLMFVNTQMGPSRIADQYEQDHATALHAKRVMKGYLSWDKILVSEAEQLQKLIDRKKLIVFNDFETEEQYYYINLENFESFKIDKEKAVIVVGFNKEEVAAFKEKNGITETAREHTRTGMYVLEKNKDEKKDKNLN
jgi:hypothetical protein